VDNKKASQVMGFDRQSREPGLAFFGAFLSKQDSIDDARNVIEATVETLAKEPPSKEEVDRAKTRLLKNLDLAVEKLRTDRSVHERMGRNRRLAFALPLP
jgi:zinc protease